MHQKLPFSPCQLYYLFISHIQYSRGWKSIRVWLHSKRCLSFLLSNSVLDNLGFPETEGSWGKQKKNDKRKKGKNENLIGNFGKILWMDAASCEPNGSRKNFRLFEIIIFLFFFRSRFHAFFECQTKTDNPSSNLSNSFHSSLHEEKKGRKNIFSGSCRNGAIRKKDADNCPPLIKCILSYLLNQCVSCSTLNGINTNDSLMYCFCFFFLISNNSDV